MKKEHDESKHNEEIPKSETEAAVLQEVQEKDNSKISSKTAQEQEDKYYTHNAYLRLHADFENYKKRMQQEQVYWNSNTKKKIFNELFSFIDSFDMALMHITPVAKSKNSGLAVLHKKLFEVIKKLGVTVTKTATGDRFDSESHEALKAIPTEDETQEGRIAQVISKGYLLDGKLIRFPQVYVYNKAS